MTREQATCAVLTALIDTEISRLLVEYLDKHGLAIMPVSAIEDAVDVAISEERISADEPKYTLAETAAMLGIKDDEP